MANRLADATSPYLQQHADNPVDWHPWDDAALARARADDKPILLSIGYSACHWCHVMAHESFEDPRVAAVMNEHFVNIKVDREERPDLDQIYQTAHALMTRRSGGWPLTMFLTPAGEPYFAGTYFPKHARHGLPGFVDLLPRAASAYHDQRERVTAQGQQLRAALATLEPAGSATALPLQASQRALQELKQSFDPLHGGFGAAPKFPHPAELEYCLRAAVVTDDPEALAVVRTTLEKMAGGGIVDQIGGGFFRYSVDAEWSIPHFEKMLYDNGPLLALYADLSRVTGDARHGDVARGIVAWLVREMRSPDGAFYSSLDADSDGCEGQFYVWTRDAAQAAMTADEWMVAEPHFGFDAPPNFEQHAWHLRVAAAIAQVARNLDIVPPDAQTRLAGARAALFAARATRVRPDRDDKILTAWNALTIAGLARAARALDEPRWADLASACVDALRQTAWRDGRLRATRRGARAELNAYLDDHAFLLLALLESMQTRFRVQDFEWATQVAGVLLEWFEDVEAGGFFFTSHDHEKLFHRPKPGRDNATPSGNGVAAQALVALGHLAGNQRYVDAANRAVRVFAPGLDETPGGHSTLLAAMDAVESPPTIVLLQGDADACREWQSALEAVYRPGVITINLAGVGELPAVLVKGALPATGGVAWICRGAHCLPPVFAWEVIERTVASTGADGAR